MDANVILEKPPWITEENEYFTRILMKNLYLPTSDMTLHHNNFFPQIIGEQKHIEPEKMVKYEINNFSDGQTPMFNYKFNYIKNDSAELLLQTNSVKIKSLTTMKENIMYEKEDKSKDKKVEQTEPVKRVPKILNAKQKQAILGCDSKINKQLENVDKVIRVRKYELYLHPSQSKVMKSWIKECMYIYNFCVDRNKMQHITTNYKEAKLIIFAEFYGTNKFRGSRNTYIQKYNEYYNKFDSTVQFTISDWFRPMSLGLSQAMKDLKKYKLEWNNKKLMPYDILTDVVQTFCANLKSNLTKVQKGLQTHFTMHHKQFKKFSSLLVTKKNIRSNGVFLNSLPKYTKFKKSLLEEINNYSESHFSKKIDVDNIKCDCRLKYERGNNKYYLCVPTFIATKKVDKREEFCALDPGEKIFQTFYGEKSCGTLGNLIRTRILEIQGTIKRLTRVLEKKINRGGYKLNNRSSIRKRIRKKYLKIENIVKELHNKSALFLCKTFERILIPKFETKKMISDHYSLLKNRAKNAKPSNVYRPKKKKITNREIKRLRKYGKPLNPPDPPDPLTTNKKRLPGNVKFVLQMQSHYKFKQHLFNKSEEYGCKINEVSEEYTSKTCGNCGSLSNNYHNRIKKCNSCKIEIDRDMNGARNILIKNIKLILMDLRCLSCDTSILTYPPGCANV